MYSPNKKQRQIEDIITTDKHFLFLSKSYLCRYMVHLGLDIFIGVVAKIVGRRFTEKKTKIIVI